MAEFLLVHGSCHGAWCWRDVVPALSALGHSVHAIDLPGLGDDLTPTQDITLDLYAEAVLSASGPDTIIVGHSMAGFPIAAAAEAEPSNIGRLVFLCAYAPVDGLSLIDMRKRAPRQPLQDVLRISDDGLSWFIDPAHVEATFYHDCPAGTLEFATARLRPQAIKPQATPISLGENYASVAKSFIRCTDDQTIPPEYQATMVADWPRDDVFDFTTSHSPFFADPEGLAHLLDQIAKGS
jgi:pimeloyl-ACP methyl ester carboxylesterase